MHSNVNKPREVPMNINSKRLLTFMKLTLDPLYRNSFFLFFGNIFNAGCGFFFWMIAANIYTVEEVGLATALISSIGLVVLFSRLGFDFSIIRFFPTNNKATIFGTSLLITTTASFLVGIMFILLIHFISPSLAFLRTPSYMIIFLLIGMVNSIAAISGQALIANKNMNSYLFQNIFMGLRVPFLIPLAFLGTVGIFISVGLSSLVASYFALTTLQKSILTMKIGVDVDFIRRSLKFSSWNYASNILSLVPILLLPLLVVAKLGEVEAAKYYIAFTLGNLILIIPQSLGTSLFVEGSHGQGLKKSVKRAGYAIIALQVPAVLILFLFGYRLLALLRGEYLEAFSLLKVMVLSSFLVAVYHVFISIQNVRMKVGSIVMLNAIRCMLLLGLSYVLIPQYGILGVGYGWMATYLVIVGIIFMVAKREEWI